MAAVESSPHYWCAYLAATITEALRTDPIDHARGGLQQAVTRFTETDACSPELRKQLKKGEK